MNDISKSGEIEGIKTFNGLLSRIFGPAADGLGLLLSAPIRERILNNQVRALRKLQEKCEKEKIDIRQINLKVVFPYLEGIALEEEPVLEELWANLMANYLDSKKNLQQVVFPSILQQLSTSDVEFLQLVHKDQRVTAYNKEAEELYKFGISEKAVFGRDLSNLERLGLIQEDLSNLSRHSGIFDHMTITMGIKTYKISDFGLSFIEACNR